MIVVADTSPLLNLERIGRLSLLPELYGRVVVPQAVLAELKAGELDVDFETLPWMEVLQASNRPSTSLILGELDLGEAEAIRLALELGADLLLIDEKRGRDVASALGLDVTGLGGILLAAKRSGLIEKVKPILDDLISIARFRLSTSLYRFLIERAGEDENSA